jgi:hypothetical protein
MYDSTKGDDRNGRMCCYIATKNRRDIYRMFVALTICYRNL